MTESEEKETTRSGRAMRDTSPYSASKAELQALAEGLRAQISEEVEHCVSRHSISRRQLVRLRNRLIVGASIILGMAIVIGAHSLRMSREIELIKFEVSKLHHHPEIRDVKDY